MGKMIWQPWGRTSGAISRESFGILACMGEPDLTVKQAQRTPDHVARALVWAHCGLDDAFVLVVGSEPDRGLDQRLAIGTARIRSVSRKTRGPV
jgi:hypothetical protein